MHSRVIQVSRNMRFDKMTEYDMPSWFCDSIADYMDEISDEETILDEQWNFLGLIEKPNLKTDDNILSFTINEDGIREYFNGKFIRFKKLIKEVEDTIDLETFSELGSAKCDIFDSGKKIEASIGTIMYEIDNLYSDKYGVYIYDTDEAMLTTLDQFIRDVSYSLRNKRKLGRPESEIKETFYLGSVFDYHC